MGPDCWFPVSTNHGTSTHSYPPCTSATPDARFDHIRIMGPMPPSKGYSCLLTCVYRFTLWPESILLPDITAATVAYVFVSSWLAHFRVPSTITTYHAAQFESVLWHQLLHLLGTTCIRTIVYHPSANGPLKRFHQHLKAVLSTVPCTQWIDILPLLLLGICSDLKEDQCCTTAELVYSTTLCHPGESFDTTATHPVSDPHTYVSCLCRIMQLLQSIPTVHHAHALQAACK